MLCNWPRLLVTVVSYAGYSATWVFIAELLMLCCTWDILMATEIAIWALILTCFAVNAGIIIWADTRVAIHAVYTLGTVPTWVG